MNAIPAIRYSNSLGWRASPNCGSRESVRPSGTLDEEEGPTAAPWPTTRTTLSESPQHTLPTRRIRTQTPETNVGQQSRSAKQFGTPAALTTQPRARIPRPPEGAVLVCNTRELRSGRSLTHATGAVSAVSSAPGQTSADSSAATAACDAAARAAKISAICTALSAAPFRRLSLLMNNARPRPPGTPSSVRMRPT